MIGRDERDGSERGLDRDTLGRRTLLRTVSAAVLGTALPATGVAAQESSAPSVKWERTYGGDGNDVFYDAVEVEDGFVFAGLDDSGPDTGGWVVRVDAEGDVCWKRTFPELDAFVSLVRAPDGGYVAADQNTLVKLDAARDVEWRAEAGGLVVALADGGYAVGSGDIAKVTETGGVEWRLDGLTNINALVQTADGSIVAGGVESFTNEFGELIGYPSTLTVSPAGAVVDGSSGDPGFLYSEVNGLVALPDGSVASAGWEFLGPEYVGPYRGDSLGIGYLDRLSLLTTTEGGYVVGGFLDEYDGLGGNRGTQLAEIGPSGEIRWEAEYGDRTAGAEVIRSSDGGYVLAGVRDVDDDFDAWVVKTA